MYYEKGFPKYSKKLKKKISYRNHFPSSSRKTISENQSPTRKISFLCTSTLHHPAPPIIYTINAPNNSAIYKRNTHSPAIFFKSKLNHIPQLSKSPIFTSSLRTPTSSAAPPIFKHLCRTSNF